MLVHNNSTTVGFCRVPTMLIAECVLVYIEPNLSSQLIKWAGNLFSTALFLNYEPVSSDLLYWMYWNFINIASYVWEKLLG